MPAFRGTVDEIMAQQIGQGLAGLFAPKSNETKLKYMLGASQIGENNANIGKLNSDTALNTQTHGNRDTLTQNAPGAFGVEANTPIANMLGAIMGLTQNSEQGMDALNKGYGGQILRTADTEGEARRGYALTGHDAAVGNALTQPGISALFGEERWKTGANNAAEIRKAGISAGAQRYAADLHYGKGGASDRAAAAMGKMFTVAPGATVFDPNTRQPLYTAPGKPGDGIGVNDSDKIMGWILEAMPEGAPVNYADVASASGEISKRIAAGTPPNVALAEVMGAWTMQEGAAPWFGFNTDPSATYDPTRVPPLPQPAAAAPVAPAGPVLSPEIQALLHKYNGGR